MLVAAFVLKLWKASPSLPWSYSWDALFYQATAKATLEHGWFLHVPELGAPFGLNSHDFSVVSNDWTQILIVKLLGISGSSAFTVVNVFHLVGFALCALTAFFVMRRLSVGRGPALITSVLFAVLPYHFQQSQQHLFFASYYSVPLVCLLVLNVLAGEELFARSANPRSRMLSWVSRRSLLTIALCLVIAGSSVYYAVFGILLVLAAGLLRLLTARSIATFAGAVLAAAVIGGFVVAAQLPTLIYHASHGTNPDVAQRTPAESEFFALKLDQLVLPMPGHRIAPLSGIGEELANTSVIRGEGTGNLGTLGTLGLAWLLLIALTTAVSATKHLGSERERHAGVATLLAFLIATVGGISAVIAFTITPQIRTWGRMAIVIGFFALLAVALLVQRAGARANSPRARGVFGVSLALLLVVGVLDQTTTRFAPDYDQLRTNFASDAGFVDRIEAALPNNAMVLQLPYSDYPEGAEWNEGAYESIRGYLQSSDLRWSYGAMRGRPEDWLAAVEDMPLNALLDGAAAAGFAGVWVDRSAFGDVGDAAVNGIGRGLGEPIVSGDGRLAFFDLRTRTRGLRADKGTDRVAAMGEVTIRPVRREFGQGFGPREGGGQDRWWWAGPRSELELHNPAQGPRRVWFDLLLRTDAPDPGMTTVTLPDGRKLRVKIDQTGTRLLERIELPPGRSIVAFETTGTPVELPRDDNRTLLVQVRNPIVVPVELCPSSGSCTSGERPQLR